MSSDSLRAYWRGYAAMTAAMALFSANDALVKAYGSTLPVAQSIAIRGAIASAATLATIFVLRQAAALRAVLDPVVVLRGLMESGAIFCLIFALTRLPIGDVTAISQTAPLILLPLATLVYGERIGLAHWLLVMLGFAGVALIAKPTRIDFDPAFGLALFTAVGFAFRDLLSRRVGAGVPASGVAFTTVAVVALSGALVALWRGLAPVTAQQVVALGGAGLLLSLGQAAVFLAFRYAPISRVAPFNYTKTVFSVMIGVASFGERPDLLAVIGIGLVVASGVGAALASGRPRRRIPGVAEESSC